MQHADRERIVKLSRERESINVGLNDVRVWQRTRRGKRSLHRYTEIDPDDVLRAPTRRELRVTSLAATTFKHDFVAKKLRRDRGDPTQKLTSVARVFLREVLPLPTKAGSSGTFVAFH